MVNNQTRVLGGSAFICELSYPSAEHSPDFVEFLGEGNILLRIQRFCLPGNLQEEFQQIKFNRTLLYLENPFAWGSISGRENTLDCFEKQRIYLPSQRISRRFRDVRHEFVPQLVCVDELPDDRQFVPSGGGVNGKLFCINLCSRK